VVGVVAKNDLIAVPEPVAGEAVVIRRQAKKGAAEPEAISPAAFEPERVIASDACCEATVCRGLIDPVMRIVAP
jgi:hypothetical protein